LAFTFVLSHVLLPPGARPGKPPVSVATYCPPRQVWLVKRPLAPWQAIFHPVRFRLPTHCSATERARDLCDSFPERYFKGERDGIVSGPGRALQVGQNRERLSGNVFFSHFRQLAASAEKAPNVIEISTIACLKDILKGNTMESFLARGGHCKLVKIAIDCQKTCFFALSALCARHRIGPRRATDLCDSLFERYSQGEHDGIVAGPGRAPEVGQNRDKLSKNGFFCKSGSFLQAQNRPRS
jgi:hypothetical protein